MKFFCSPVGSVTFERDKVTDGFCAINSERLVLSRIKNPRVEFHTRPKVFSNTAQASGGSQIWAKIEVLRNGMVWASDGGRHVAAVCL